MEKKKLIKGVNGTPIEETKTTQFAVPTVDGRLDMVIAFDTTGSMARYIDDVREQVSIHGLPWYKQLSEITGGVSVPFRSDNKTAELIEAASLSRSGRNLGVCDGLVCSPAARAAVTEERDGCCREKKTTANERGQTRTP